MAEERLRILIVEDDPEFANLTSDKIKRKFEGRVDVRSVLVGNSDFGEEIVVIKPDLLITDGLRGSWEEVVDMVRRRFPGTEVCLYTGEESIIEATVGNELRFGLTRVIDKADKPRLITEFVGEIIKREQTKNREL